MQVLLRTRSRGTRSRSTRATASWMPRTIATAWPTRRAAIRATPSSRTRSSRTACSASICAHPGTGGNIDAPAGVPLQNTPGGPHQGANLLQNYPVLSSAISSASSTVITGIAEQHAQRDLPSRVLRQPHGQCVRIRRGQNLPRRYFGDDRRLRQRVVLRDGARGKSRGPGPQRHRDGSRQQYVGVFQRHPHPILELGHLPPA